MSALTGTDREIYDFVLALVASEVRKHPVLLCASSRGTGAIERSITKRVAEQAINAVLPHSSEVISAKIKTAVAKRVARLEAQPANADIDRYGPYNMLPFLRRQPTRAQGGVKCYGSNPEKGLAGLDEYEKQAQCSTKQGQVKAWYDSSPANRPNVEYGCRPLYSDASSFPRPDDVKFKREEVNLPPPQLADVPETLTTLDTEYFLEAIEQGQEILVLPSAGLGLTSRRILETAVLMAGEMARTRYLGEGPKRKSRAKEPGLPKWTDVAARLGMNAKTVQKSVQRLKPLPINKLFCRVSAGDR